MQNISEKSKELLGVGVAIPDLTFASDAPLERQPYPTDYLLKWFKYSHLPSHLQIASQPFAEMAQWICNNIAASPERAAGLRKLLEAKDCIVRAFLSQQDSE
jgi:hypothetical protein